jgi:hypothetical protein
MGPHDGCNRRNITEEIETEMIVKSRVDCGACSDEEERIPIRSGPYDSLRCDITAGARTIVDDELRTQSLG